ncbi:tyrosine-type recombinase/integrase [Pseudomonas aeruginosa]
MQQAFAAFAAVRIPRWRGHLENLLSKAEKKKARQRQHFPAMHWRDLPKLMSKLAQDSSRDAVAARLLILTGARSHMIRFAQWPEMDFAAGTWALPAERMKMRKPFVIPSPSGCGYAAKPTSYEFTVSVPAEKARGEPHMPMPYATLLHKLRHADITRHGFRSTFRDWANENITTHERYANSHSLMTNGIRPKPLTRSISRETQSTDG